MVNKCLCCLIIINVGNIHVIIVLPKQSHQFFLIYCSIPGDTSTNPPPTTPHPPPPAQSPPYTRQPSLTCTLNLKVDHSKDDLTLYTIIIKIIGLECRAVPLNDNHDANITILDSTQPTTQFIMPNIIMYHSAHANPIVLPANTLKLTKISRILPSPNLIETATSPHPHLYSIQKKYPC
jgi:hypothetical protein